VTLVSEDKTTAPIQGTASNYEVQYVFKQFSMKAFAFQDFFLTLQSKTLKNSSL